MTITCLNCGAIDDFRTEQKATNIVATCNHCDKFIKNLPYDKPRMYIGKYKGMDISEITDKSYLKWALEKVSSLSKRQREAIEFRIKELN